MGRQIRKSKGKTMKPNFFVFCEGESEVAYISHLRSQYRVPIQIIPRKSDSNISIRYIENCKRDYIETENDKTFLMFDLDVAGMLEHLQSIPDAILLVSNPCKAFELMTVGIENSRKHYGVDKMVFQFCWQPRCAKWLNILLIR